MVIWSLVIVCIYFLLHHLRYRVPKIDQETDFCTNYLWDMLHVGSSPTSVSTVDTNYIFRHFTIDFRTSIKNPFKSHRFAWISKYVTRYFHNLPSCNPINILLLFSTKRFIWNEIQSCLVLQDIWSFEVILKYRT